MHNLFFNDWESVLKAFVATLTTYAALLILIRISGKRTLSKMNAYDFIVTIALGSCLAATALDKTISLVDGAVVYATLIFLQFSITWISVRYTPIKKVVSGTPSILLYKGEFMYKTMKEERITLEEINVAARNQGIESLKNTYMIILETTGDIAIIQQIGNSHPETLPHVDSRND